jgi:hypothetical protein
MESTITQHGSGSRTMWACGIQLILRPRPAQLTSGTIGAEEAAQADIHSLPEVSNAHI